MTALGMSAGWRTLIQGAIIVSAVLFFGALQHGSGGMFRLSSMRLKTLAAGLRARD